MMNKNELRKYIRTEKRHFSQSELAEMSLSVINRLLAHPRLQVAKTVMLYYSLPDEVCTHSLIDRLVSRYGKSIILPVVIGEGLMELRRYTGPNDLKEGAYGIMEPVGELFTSIDSLDLIIVPGMAFDSTGNRLGKGKGYYDRFLHKAKNIYKIGVCFDFQKTDHVPADEHDVPMDEVL